jgi:PBP1b-binding outer membrane lipoprotein LpoB
MKTLLSILLVIFVMAGCTNQDLEKRIKNLEKSSLQKDNQIKGLTLLAQYQLIDTTNTNLDSAKIVFPEEILKHHEINLLTNCQKKCLKAFSQKLNMCEYVPPQNKLWCQNQAAKALIICLGKCK